jgi:predicted GIY-YIG superfamily endonuclease
MDGVDENEIENEQTPAKNYIVYVLHNEQNPCTYVGSTNNPARRLRQHNGELVGGAKYTHRHGSQAGGNPWKYFGYIPGLDKHRALSIEKRIQIRSRRMKAPRAIDRRVQAVEQILADVNDPELSFCRGSPLSSSPPPSSSSSVP